MWRLKRRPKIPKFTIFLVFRLKKRQECDHAYGKHTGTNLPTWPQKKKPYGDGGRGTEVGRERRGKEGREGGEGRRGGRKELFFVLVIMEMKQVLIEQGDLFYQYLEQFSRHEFLKFIYFVSAGSFTADNSLL